MGGIQSRVSSLRDRGHVVYVTAVVVFVFMEGQPWRTRSNVEELI